jgi:hypothetical protein
VAEARFRARAARRPAHITLDRPVGPRGPGHGVPDSPQSGWPPASARVPSSDTRLDTVSDDQFLLRTPGSGWPGDGHGRPLDRPVGRTSPVQWDHLADGSGPGPDSDGQAADTSSAQRPTIRLASRPRPTTRPTRPGPDRTGQQCAYSPSANPSHGQHRDPPGHHHLHLCSMPGRPQAWSPSDVRAVPSGVHNGHHDRTAFRTPHAQSYAPDTVPFTRHTMANRKRRGQGTDERHSRPSVILDRHDHKGGPQDTPSPSCGAGVCGLATKVGSAMATLPARP